MTNDDKASKAVDCNLTTRATSTDNYNEGDYWWKVDIGERIIFTYATIYVRDGRCGPSESRYSCCKYYMYWLLELVWLAGNKIQECFVISNFLCVKHTRNNTPKRERVKTNW